MTTGKPTRLSEKLNADLDKIRKEHAALMDSQLQSFRSDIQACVTLARNTIEADTRTFLDWSGTTWQSHIDKIKFLIQISPWAVITACMVLIAATLGLTFLWSWKLSTIAASTQLERLGIQAVLHEGATYLILPPETSSMRTCSVASRLVSCIRVEPN